MLRRFLSSSAPRRDLNRILLLGRVAGAPSTHTFQSEADVDETVTVQPDDAGTTPRPPGVVQFTLATNRVSRNRQGEMIDVTDWHRVKKFGLGVVDSLAPRLEKGTTVLVEGQLRYETYTDKEGRERSVGTVHADRVQVVKKPNTSMPSS